MTARVFFVALETLRFNKVCACPFSPDVSARFQCSRSSPPELMIRPGAFAKRTWRRQQRQRSETPEMTKSMIRWYVELFPHYLFSTRDGGWVAIVSCFAVAFKAMPTTRLRTWVGWRN